MSYSVSFKRAIVPSILATLLVIYFVQPLISLTWGFLEFFGSRWVDEVYFGAAMGSRNYVVVGWDIILMEALFGVTIGYVTYVIITRNSQSGHTAETKLGRRAAAFSRFFTSRTVGCVFLFMLLVTNGLRLESEFMDLQLNTSFQQRLAALSPHISDQEHKEFLADWANMRGRIDYERLAHKMEAVANARAVLLPDYLSGTRPSH